LQLLVPRLSLCRRPWHTARLVCHVHVRTTRHAERSGTSAPPSRAARRRTARPRPARDLHSRPRCARRPSQGRARPPAPRRRASPPRPRPPGASRPPASPAPAFPSGPALPHARQMHAPAHAPPILPASVCARVPKPYREAAVCGGRGACARCSNQQSLHMTVESRPGGSCLCPALSHHPLAAHRVRRSGAAQPCRRQCTVWPHHA